MAKKDTNIVDEKVTDDVKATGNKMVKIKLPRLRNDDSDVFVSVNERTFLIKRGVEVEVPECVKEVLDHQEEMINTIFDFNEENEK